MPSGFKGCLGWSISDLSDEWQQKTHKKFLASPEPTEEEEEEKPEDTVGCLSVNLSQSDTLDCESNTSHLGHGVFFRSWSAWEIRCQNRYEEWHKRSGRHKGNTCLGSIVPGGWGLRCEKALLFRFLCITSSFNISERGPLLLDVWQEKNVTTAQNTLFIGAQSEP